MNRHYYISDNLDELERLEAELEASGIATEQIHVLSEKDAETGQRHLHEVSPLLLGWQQRWRQFRRMV